MFGSSSYISQLKQDVFNYNKSNSITKDHYILLLDYILPEYQDVLFHEEKEDNQIDLEILLFEWYKNYDCKAPKTVVSLTPFDEDEYLPLSLNAYIYLRVLKLGKTNNNLEEIVNIICAKYEIFPRENKYLEGLVMPFIEYTKILTSTDEVKPLSLDFFSEKANYSFVLKEILLLAIKKNDFIDIIIENILVRYALFNLDSENTNEIIHSFLESHCKQINYDFLAALLKTGNFTKTVIDFIVNNLNRVPLTLYDINSLFDDELSLSEINVYNLTIPSLQFKNKYLPVMNLLMTKDIKLAHDFLRKGTVQLQQFDILFERRPEVFNKGSDAALPLFNRIPRDYMLQKLINISNNSDSSIFSKEMIINKFWYNFKQANTSSRTNRFLINCEDIALNNLSDVDNFVNLINLVHLFPIHFKPENILNFDNDSLIEILVKEQQFNVIDTFNIIKKLNLVLERGDNDNDEYLLLKCQSNYINYSNDEDFEYLESTMTDFIDLLSEFKEYKCIFTHDKSLDTMWLRLIQFANNANRSRDFFNMLIKLVPLIGNNTKYLDLLF